MTAVSRVVSPPPGGHEEEGAAEAAFPQRGGEALQVAGHEGLDVCVGARGGEAFVFAHLGADAGGQRDGEAGPLCREDLAYAPFVGGVGVAVDEPDRDRFDAVFVEDGQERVDRVLIEGDEDAAVAVDAFPYGEAEAAGDEWRGAVDADVVLLEAVLLGHLERIAVPLGADQRGAGALALDDGIGGEGGAMDGEPHGGGRDLRRVEHPGNRIEDALFGGGVRGEDLGGDEAAARLQCHVGEGAADVDGEAGRGFVRRDAPRLGPLPAPGVRKPGLRVDGFAGCGHVNGYRGCPARLRGAARCS